MPVVPLPIFAFNDNRDATTDQDSYLKNQYVEKFGDIYKATKRPGLSQYDSDDTGGDNVGRGCYAWEGKVYKIIDNKMYYDSTAMTGTLDTSTGRCYFAEFAHPSTADKKLLFHDGTEIYYVDSGTPTAWTKITDADIPASLVAGIEVFDGYVFIGSNASNFPGRIYNSDSAAPETWTATNFLTAETRSDEIKALVRYLDYLLALNTYSIEIFYNAANASGSPLSRYKGTSILIGCVNGHTAAKIDETVIFVGQTEKGGRSVYVMEGLRPVKISNKGVDKILDEEGSNISDAYAYAISYQGHSMYILTLPTTAAKTFVFDLTEQVWHEWSSYNGSTETYFTGVASCVHNGATLIQDEDNGKLYTFDRDVYQDDSNTIKVLGRLPLFDGGTQENKFCYRLEVVGDRTPTAANLSISWSDDDYNNFVTARTVDLSGRAMLTRLGKFQRRAFQYTFEEDDPLRLEGFSLELSKGSYGA